MSKPILFFGNEKLATGVTTDRPVLRALQSAGYDVVEVPSKNLDKNALTAYEAEAAILIAFGQLIGDEILEIFPKGIINVHPSLLPLYRGSTPIESAILDGATETGVSLMKLVPEMDAGPVYAQQAIRLSDRESKQGLADTLAGIGSDLIVKHMPAILDGSLLPQTQDDTKATYTKLITKSDGLIDWSKPAAQIEREVRAYAGWPRSQTKLGTTDVIVTKSHAGNGSGQPGAIRVDNKQIGVYTGDGVLYIDSLIPAGKKEMSAEAFLAGYRL